MKCKYLTVKCSKIIDNSSITSIDETKYIIVVDKSKKFLLGSRAFVTRASTSLIDFGRNSPHWSSVGKSIECEIFEDQSLPPQLNQAYVSQSLAKRLNIGLNQKLKLMINETSKTKQIARYPFDIKISPTDNGIILMWGGLDWMFYPNGILAIVVKIDSKDSTLKNGVGFSSLFFQNIWGVSAKHVQIGERVCKLTRNDSIVNAPAWLASGKNALPGSGIRLTKNLAKAINAKIGSLVFIKHFACGIRKGEFVTDS